MIRFPCTTSLRMLVERYNTLTIYSPRYSTQCSTRGRVTRPQFFNFEIRLRLDLGYKALIFASTTNLKLGPRFTDILSKVYFSNIQYNYKFYNFFLHGFNPRSLGPICEVTQDNNEARTSRFLRYFCKKLKQFIKPVLMGLSKIWGQFWGPGGLSIMPASKNCESDKTNFWLIQHLLKTLKVQVQDKVFCQ